MRATDLAIQWIGTLCALALLGSLAAMLVNALTVKDPEMYKGCLVVAAIATTGVGGLVGYIGGYHVGRNEAGQNPPTMPTGGSLKSE